MIQVNPEYLGVRNKFYWTHGYVLISREAEDCVPVFLRHTVHDVYVCGKTVNLLKLCCPQVGGQGRLRRSVGYAEGWRSSQLLPKVQCGSPIPAADPLRHPLDRVGTEVTAWQ